MSDNLETKLKLYGTPSQVGNTIEHITKHTKWIQFITDYRYDGKLINPHSIRDIVENYYNNLTDASPAASPVPVPVPSPSATTTSIATNGLRFIKSEMLPTGKTCPYRELKEYEKWYFYEDENGEEIKTKTNLHGGKRKS
jgi:hypothetical protein